MRLPWVQMRSLVTAGLTAHTLQRSVPFEFEIEGEWSEQISFSVQTSSTPSPGPGKDVLQEARSNLPVSVIGRIGRVDIPAPAEVADLNGVHQYVTLLAELRQDDASSPQDDGGRSLLMRNAQK